MTVLNIQGGFLSRSNITQIVLDLSELRTALSIPALSRFYTLSNWKRVTITYASDLNRFQTKELIFDMSHPQTQTVINDKLEQYFIGNPLISGVTIHDYENGKDVYSRWITDLSFLDILGDLDVAPSSVFYESSDGQSGKIPLEDIPLWVIGWKIRVYDIINQRYFGPPVEIVSIDGVTGLVTLSAPTSVQPNVMVLESPNETLYEVKADNLGVLSTIPTVLPATNRFNIDEERTGVKWVIKVSNSGDLYIEDAILDDLDLPTRNNYAISSPNNKGWRLSIKPVQHWQNVSGSLDIGRVVKQYVTNGDKFEFIVGNDGLFSSILGQPSDVITPQFAIVDPISGTEYALRVDIDGEFFLVLNQDNLKPNQNFLMASPNGTPFKIKASIANQPKLSSSFQIESLVLESQNGTKWKVTVADDGTLSTEDDNLSNISPLFNFNQGGTESMVMLKVSDSGVLFVETLLSPEEENYSTNDNFLLRSLNGSVWKIVYNEDGNLDMVSDFIVRSLVLQAPDGNKYAISVNNNGFMTVELNNTLTPTTGFRVSFESETYVIKITNDRRIYASVASGGTELGYPLNDSFYMISPNLVIWSMTVQSLPQIQSYPYEGVKTLVIEAPSGDKFQVVVDNQGDLSTVLNNALNVTSGFTIDEPVFNDRYVFKVTNAGVLYLEVASGGDLLLPTDNNYQLASDDMSTWRLRVVMVTELSTVEAQTTLVDMALRFAYSNEVTLDQLSRFKFD